MAEERQREAAEYVCKHIPTFRAEAIRHIFLVSSFLYLGKTVEEIVALSGLNFDEAKGNPLSDTKEVFAITLRWPKGHDTSSRIEGICKKAEQMKKPYRHAYLLGLFILGYDLYCDGSSIALTQSNNNLTVTNADASEKPFKNAVPSADKGVSQIENPTSKSDVKQALSSLMKRN